jgi:hypothetical protein
MHVARGVVMVVIVTHASRQSALLGRASTAGFYAGGVSGLIAGTAAFPVLGTGIGALVGIVVGLVFGVVNGLVLAGVARWTRSRRGFGVVAAVTSGLCAVAVAAAANGGWQPVFVLGSGALVFVCWCVLLGAVLGSVGARWAQPERAADLRRCALVSRYATCGGLVAAGCGAVAGLVLGLIAYPPAALAALIEGAIVSAGPGAVIGATIGLAGCARALRAQR